VLFALVEDFERNVLDTQVDLGGGYRRLTLRQALARSAAQLKAMAFA
jgi:hypothetical protein